MGWFGSSKNEEGADIGLAFEEGYTYYLGKDGNAYRTLTSGISGTPPFFSGPIEMVANANVSPAKRFHYFVNKEGNVTRLAAPATSADFEKTYANLTEAEKLSIAVSITGVHDSEQLGSDYDGGELFNFLVLKKTRDILNTERKKIGIEPKTYEGKSKSEELREAKALLDDGIINEDDFKQMKEDILGK